MKRVLVILAVAVLCVPVLAQETKVDFPAEIARIYGLKKAGQKAVEASKLDDAAKAYQEAIDAQTKLYGADNAETLETMSLLAGVYEKQERWADAFALREKLVDTHRRLYGAAPDDVVWSMTGTAFGWSQKLYGGINDTPQDLACARDLIRRLRERSKPFAGTLNAESGPDLTSQWVEAWTEYKSGNGRQAMKIIAPGFAVFPKNPYGHMVMALFSCAAGEKDLAHDWYLAACESANDPPGSDKDFNDLKQVVVAKFAASQYAVPQLEPVGCLEAYGRLLAIYPQLIPLNIRRGTCAARTGNLALALADFRTVLESQPEDASNWYHLAMVSMFAGEVDEYKKTLAGMYSKFAKSPNPFERHLLMIIWSLAPNPEISADEMLELARRPDRPDDTRVARVLYRCGKFEEALANKPDGTVAALTHHKLGNKAAAERSLTQSLPYVQSARDPVTRCISFSSPGTAIEWLENEILLREAQQLVGPGVQPFFEKFAQVLVGDWVGTGTVSSEGQDELLKAGDNFTMAVSLRLAAGGKAVVGPEKLTVENRANVSAESFVTFTWDPVERAIWILAPWSNGSSELGSLTSVEPNGFRGTYTVHLPDGNQATCDIAMEMESNDKFAWVLKSGPRAGQCLSTWQRKPAAAAGQ